MKLLLISFYNWLICSVRLLGNSNIRNKSILIRTYGRLHLKNIFSKWFHLKLTTEKIFGYEIEFHDYSTFVYLFEEIFMQQNYYFTSNSPSPHIIDAGSNIGMAIIYFKTLYPMATIDAYEPSPEAFRILQKNIQRNGISNITLFNEALSDRNGTLALSQDLIGGHPSLSTVGKAIQTIEVPCRNFSAAVNVKTDFLKMDIEGAEYICLLDAEKNNSLEKIHEMIFEFHHYHNTNGNLAAFLSILEKAHFRFNISAALKTPFDKSTDQDILIHAYKI